MEAAQSVGTVVVMSIYRCGCSTANRAICLSTDTWAGRRTDGSCDCSCHGEYADDPENWCPLYIPDPDVDAEIRDGIEFEVAFAAAEALIEEQP